MTSLEQSGFLAYLLSTVLEQQPRVREKHERWNFREFFLAYFDSKFHIRAIQCQCGWNGESPQW